MKFKGNRIDFKLLAIIFVTLLLIVANLIIFLTCVVNLIIEGVSIVQIGLIGIIPIVIILFTYMIYDLNNIIKKLKK